jgi:hypothetical protein
MHKLENNYAALKCLTWSGFALIIGVFASMLVMGFLPPQSPHANADEIAAIFRDDTTRIRVGAVLMMVTFSFWVTFGAAVSLMIRRMEPDLPVVAYSSLALVGGILTIMVLIPLTWAVAAFRPDDLTPQILIAMNDFTWFLFVFTVVPFALWMLLIASTMLRDKSEHTIYPRWMAYFTLWSALLLAPALMIPFFKTGPFAWNGLLAFWLPLTVFAVWYVTLVVQTLVAVRHEEAYGVEPAVAREPALAG